LIAVKPQVELAGRLDPFPVAAAGRGDSVAGCRSAAARLNLETGLCGFNV
jgi:hypothetical protein